TDCIYLKKRSDARPPQGADMPIAAKASAQMAGKRAHIGALAAAGLKNRGVTPRVDEIECMNCNGASRQFRHLAATRQIIGAFAIDLDRGKGGRPLLEQPGKSRQQRFDLSRRGTYLGLRDSLPLAIVGVGFNPPA